jgi:patatin-like phospholipase/acyl hydrolase
MPSNGLRVLCLDGGGMKSYTSLLILNRILRTMASEGSLPCKPKPCDIFDLIVGTSTGGIIAVMLGRLGMTVDDCLEEFKATGKAVFDKTVSSTTIGKIFKGASGSAFYDIKALQKRIKHILQERKLDSDTPFLEDDPSCKVYVAF